MMYCSGLIRNSNPANLKSLIPYQTDIAADIMLGAVGTTCRLRLRPSLRRK